MKKFKGMLLACDMDGTLLLSLIHIFCSGKENKEKWQ